LNALVPALVSRNSPCPCGSGKRYKECHGAVAPIKRGGAVGAGAQGDPLPPRRRSSYRAPAKEWSSLNEEEGDEYGALMERALQQQRAGLQAEAARTYAQVLARVPQTHDALHMLGVIELGRGNLEEAERLIVAAAALRPAYRAIEHNQQLLEDAKRARESASHDELCERALPLLADLVIAPDGEPSLRRSASWSGMHAAPATVHLIGRVDALAEDDGWLLTRLTQLLEGLNVVVWAADAAPAIPVSDNARVRRLDPDVGAYPREGIQVFVGLNADDDNTWSSRSQAGRVIVFCVGASPSLYLDQLRSIACDGSRRIELVFPSAVMATRFGRGHAVLPPPLEPLAVAPATPPQRQRPYSKWIIEDPPAWPVGVVGQNGRVVAEPSDVDFLRGIAARTGRLDVYDPGRLRYALGGDRLVHFHPRREAGFLAVLASVRCLLYRLPEHWWFEGSGRELFDAMSVGLPVLCPRASLYAEYIRDGIDGLLYDTYDEAYRYLTELRTAPMLAAEIGAAARETASRLFDQRSLERSYREFIAGPSHPIAARLAFPERER
jgi:hypothetical protein